MRPLLQLRDASPALVVAVLFAFALGTPRAASPTASVTQGDFAGLVDIGAGRHLYLECRGTSSPVVVLEQFRLRDFLDRQEQQILRHERERKTKTSGC
jgi:hypothetical protein